MSDIDSVATPAHGPLHALHIAHGARMVTATGSDLPDAYGDDPAAEHSHTRASAGLFDLSHLGQAFVVGPDHATTAGALEAFLATDIRGLAPGQQRYALLLNENGGIVDDMIVTRSAEPEEDGVCMLVANADSKDAVFARISASLPPGVRLLRADHRALVALQGPEAARVLARHFEDAASMGFMTARSASFDGIACQIARHSFTGEDGFEISVKGRSVTAIVERLLDEPKVRLAGMAALESLRIEAGLPRAACDFDRTASPVEAGLAWSLDKERLEQHLLPAAARLRAELADGPARLRVGIKLLDGADALGMEIKSIQGETIGRVTSAVFGPSVGASIAIGYVTAAFAHAGTSVKLTREGAESSAEVASLPFVPHRHPGAGQEA